MPKATLADHMLHAAGIPLGGLWLYACIHQKTGEKAVFLIGLLGYLATHISQAEEEILDRKSVV